MEVSVKEARDSIGTQKGEKITISRRGKKVALLVPLAVFEKRLPDQSDFSFDINPPPLVEDPERFYRSGVKYFDSQSPIRQVL